MKLTMPGERVYYYECSNGKFLLTYFIPLNDLKQLIKKRQIHEKVLFDYPDGVDLGCNEIELVNFAELYGYRPKIDIKANERAFYALLTSTLNWEQFRGTGIIPTKDLERYSVNLNEKISGLGLFRELEPRFEKLLPNYRIKKNEFFENQGRIKKVLKESPMDGIHPEKTLSNQKFSSIKWTKGENPETFFSRLHQRKKKGR